MAKLEVEIPVSLKIQEETIIRCLKIIEWWLNEDFDRDLVITHTRNKDGIYRAIKVVSKKEVAKELDNAAKDLSGKAEKE